MWDVWTRRKLVESSLVDQVQNAQKFIIDLNPTHV